MPLEIMEAKKLKGKFPFISLNCKLFVYISVNFGCLTTRICWINSVICWGIVSTATRKWIWNQSTSFTAILRIFPLGTKENNRHFISMSLKNCRNVSLIKLNFAFLSFIRLDILDRARLDWALEYSVSVQNEIDIILKKVHLANAAVTKEDKRRNEGWGYAWPRHARGKNRKL